MEKDKRLRKIISLNEAWYLNAIGEFELDPVPKGEKYYKGYNWVNWQNWSIDYILHKCAVSISNFLRLINCSVIMSKNVILWKYVLKYLEVWCMQFSLKWFNNTDAHRDIYTHICMTYGESAYSKANGINI